MTEHVHEWRFGEDEFGRLIFVCGEPDCDVILKPEDAITRLNATERLSVEEAKVLLGDYPETYKENVQAVNALRAYADTLEGK
jgi:hypothetical protein